MAAKVEVGRAGVSGDAGVAALAMSKSSCNGKDRGKGMRWLRGMYQVRDSTIAALRLMCVVYNNFSARSEWTLSLSGISVSVSARALN